MVTFEIAHNCLQLRQNMMNLGLKKWNQSKLAVVMFLCRCKDNLKKTILFYQKNYACSKGIVRESQNFSVILAVLLKKLKKNCPRLVYWVRSSVKFSPTQCVKHLKSSFIQNFYALIYIQKYRPKLTAS